MEHTMHNFLPQPYCAKVPGIYAIINRDSGKIYIGSAKHLHHRWKTHRYGLRNKSHIKHLQYSFNKNPESFYIEVIEEIPNATQSDLETREQFWMDFYQSYNRIHGYNTCRKAYSPASNFFTSRCRPVLQFTLGGVFVKKYKSVSEAARVFGCKSSNIGASCSKDGRRMANGFVWRYADDASQGDFVPVRQKKPMGHGKKTLGRSKVWTWFVCAHCDKEFEVPPHRVAKAKYCSAHCKNVVGGNNGWRAREANRKAKNA